MRRWLAVAVLVLAAVPLLAAVAALPPQGSLSNPTNTHVVPRYLEKGAEEAGAENIVTDIILNYRGYDTEGEVTVIFTALVAVLAVSLVEKTPTVGRAPERIPPSPVVLFVVRVMVPFVLILAVYIILYGHVTPGGGFQGGAVLGALVIAASLVMGGKRTRRWIPERARPWIQPAAIVAFTTVGVTGFAFGEYLTFPQEHALAWFRTVELMALEVGIGVGGAAIIASIFWAMEEE